MAPPSRPQRKSEPYIAPDVLPHCNSGLPSATLLYASPTPDDDCRICRRPLSSFTTTAKLQCDHVFHRSCIEASLRHRPACPTCGDAGCIEPSFGTSPSGTLHHSILRDRPCPGFPDAPSTILIEYHVPHGVQKPYHPHPGRRFEGFSRREAFLPDNPAGRALLTRIVYAWKRGLVFSVGTSATTGRSDAVVWSSLVPHKTSLRGGPHGWPDGDFLRACHETLDALHVPGAEGCEPRADHLTLATLPIVVNEAIRYTADDSTATATVPQTAGLEPLSRFPLSTENCRICGERLSSGFCVEVQACRHAFHRSCLERGLLRGVNHSNESESRPSHLESTSRFYRVHHLRHISVFFPSLLPASGTMCIDRENALCPGFEPARTIKITYRIPSGIQTSHHPHPGRHHGGTTRTAYLPNNDEGIRLLQRLRYAWTQGLIFTVGYSVTYRRGDCVTWATIPHKTRLDGGDYGFPDPFYVDHCNKVLDELLVP
ncbi:hypothetical protein ACHAXS_010614 [Conticribra weissflogii]